MIKYTGDTWKGRLALRKTYLVEAAQATNDEILFTLQSEPEGKWTTANRVITNSDDMAFVYAIDENNEFSYLVFPQAMWHYLLKTMQLEKDPSVVIRSEKVVLSGLYEEIQALIYNIEGNSNYGEAFVTAVEEAFSEILELA